jgi:hypothetical protein
MYRKIVFCFFLAVAPQARAQLTIQAVVNAASYQEGLPLGGGLASIFVSGLTGTPGLTAAPTSQPLPNTLAGVQVTVNGAFAPILAVYVPPSGSAAYGQINIQVPLERNATIQTNGDGWPMLGDVPGEKYDIGPTAVAITQGTQTATMPTGTNLVRGSWIDFGGFFTDGKGNAVAQHAADYSLVTAQNPAHPGETIIVYADDFFPVWPPPPIGVPTPLQPLYKWGYSGTGDTSYYLFFGDDDYFAGELFLQATPTLHLGSSQSQPSYSCADTPAVQIAFQGLAPGMIGVEQINFVVPAFQQPGNWALFFNNGTDPDGDCAGGGIYYPPIASSAPVMLPVD